MEKGMVIVRIQGGLGNQLFQYALYESFRERGIAARADLMDYFSGREKRAYELSKLGLHPKMADPAQLHRYYADQQRVFDRACRYTLGRKKYRKEKNYDFEPWVLEMKDGYVSGYWQNERYFDKAADGLRKKISFRHTDTENVVHYRNKMNAENAVSIHIRLGDYENTSDLYGGICTPAYYKEAIAYMNEKVEHPVFYVFSDTPERAKELLSGCEYELVAGNRGKWAYLDMYLMSLCRHHIIANSTFGWWGAWLDGRKDKIVVTPPKWNHLCKGHGICCEGWVMCGEH